MPEFHLLYTDFLSAFVLGNWGLGKRLNLEQRLGKIYNRDFDQFDVLVFMFYRTERVIFSFRKVSQNCKVILITYLIEFIVEVIRYQKKGKERLEKDFLVNFQRGLVAKRIFLCADREGHFLSPNFEQSFTIWFHWHFFPVLTVKYLTNRIIPYQATRFIQQSRHPQCFSCC